MGALYRIDQPWLSVVQCPTDDWQAIFYRYNDQSLARNGLKRSDADEILDRSNKSTRVFDLPLSASENLQFMFVGFNKKGRLLEIGVQHIDEGITLVFHGQSVSPRFHNLYKETLANEKED